MLLKMDGWSSLLAGQLSSAMSSANNGPVVHSQDASAACARATIVEKWHSPLPNDDSFELLLRFAFSFLHLPLLDIRSENPLVGKAPVGLIRHSWLRKCRTKTINKHHHVRPHL